MQDLFYTNKFKKKSNFLLSNLEMSQIDKMATYDGIPSIKLMENAGKKIAQICSQIMKKNSFKKNGALPTHSFLAINRPRHSGHKATICFSSTSRI